MYTENLEYSVVGAVCIEPRVIRELHGKVLPDDFEDEACAAVMRAAFDTDAKGEAFDYVIAAEAIKDIKGAFAQGFIVECMQLTPTVHNARLHAELVHKAACKRNLRTEIEDALLGDEPEEIAAEIAAICRKQMQSANSRRMKSVQSVLLSMYENIGASQLRVDTGFSKTDAILKGMWGGNLCVVGARPGVGKTAFAISLAVNAAKRGHKVLIYSLEMLADEVVERMIAQNGVTMDELIDMDAQNAATMRKMNGASANISSLPIFINDDPSTTVSRIRAQAAQIPDLHMIIVDFLTLMRSDRRYDNRNLEVGAISRELKLLAAELQIPVIALAQLSRNKDEDEMPTLRDLRDSGEIEQNANKVMLLWNADKESGMVGLYIAKNRRGATGQVCFRFDGSHMLFTELPHEVPHKQGGMGGKRKVFA